MSYPSLGARIDPHPDARRCDAMLAALAAAPALRMFAEATVATAWREAGLPTSVVPELFAAMSEAALTPDSEAAAAQVRGILASRCPRWQQAYAAARARKFDTFAAWLSPYVGAGAVVDVGAGSTALLDRLGPRERAFAVDIEIAAPPHGSGVTAVPQPDPRAIPLPADYVDVAMATGVLHHIAADVRADLLRDVWRVLRPGGRLVLLEETFESEPPPPEPTVQGEAARPSGSQADGAPSRDPWRLLTADFRELPVDQRVTFLEFTDWWGNRVMKDSRTIPLPFTFLALEQWRPVLAAAGFHLTAARDLGVVTAGGHLATPRMILVAQRSETIPDAAPA